jgi:hypothetical protein
MNKSILNIIDHKLKIIYVIDKNRYENLSDTCI